MTRLSLAWAVVLTGALSVASGCIDFTAARSAYCDNNPDPQCKGSGDGGSDAGEPCFNGVKDSTEADIDCGGSCAQRCALDAGCTVLTDCVSNQCNLILNKCTTGACADGVKNNQETDIDCGGGGSCPKCALYKTCTLTSDCTSDNCDGTNHRCEPYPLTWDTGPGRICGRSNPAAWVQLDRIYVGGPTAGCDAGTENDPESIVEYLPPNEFTWVENPLSGFKMKMREGATLLQSGENIFVVGGFSDSRLSTTKVTQGSDGGIVLKQLANMATNRAYHAAAVLSDGRIFVAGGHGSDEVDLINAHSSTELFTPDPTLVGLGTWADGPPLGTYRAGAGAVATPDGRIFVMGGTLKYAQVNPLTTVEVFPADGGSPTSLPPMPIARAFFGMALAPDGRIYLAGGTTPSGVTNRVDAYDPEAGQWTRVPDMPGSFMNVALLVGPDNRLTAIPGKNGLGGIQTAGFYSYGPRFTLNPTSAAPGASVAMTGNEFPLSTQISVRLDAVNGTELTNGTTRATGQLPNGFAFTVPAGTSPGRHTVFIYDAKSRYPVKALLNVLP